MILFASLSPADSFPDRAFSSHAVTSTDKPDCRSHCVHPPFERPHFAGSNREVRSGFVSTVGLDIDTISCKRTDPSQQQAFSGLTYEDIIATQKGRDIARGLVNALINQQIRQQVSVSVRSDALDFL